jgi:hypothetical protein
VLALLALLSLGIVGIHAGGIDGDAIMILAENTTSGLAGNLKRIINVD